LLDGVAGSADQPSPEQQEDFMNTDTIADRVIAVDYGMALADMIAAGKYDWVDPDITAGKFKVEGTGTKKFRTKLFAFGRDISSEDAAAAMKAEHFTPATHVHGLAFGAAFPEEQRKYPIACLGSSAQVHGGRDVVYLYGDDGGRDLNLGGWVGDWYDGWRFLGVQEVSAA
jgi:hypothetical protein